MENLPLPRRDSTPVLSPEHDSHSEFSPATHRAPNQPWGRLLCLNGPGSANAIDLVNDEYVVGRGPDADVVVDDAPNCSRYHFHLMLFYGMPLLHDTSTNGTLVDGRLVSQAKMSLTTGCEIEIQRDKFFVFLNLLETVSPHFWDKRIIGDYRYYVLASRTLGRGSFATVKLAIDCQTGERLACKVIDQGGSCAPSTKSGAQNQKQGDPPEHLPSSRQTIQRETAILKNVTHPNIVQVKDIVTTSSTVYIFLTRVSGGELFDYIQRNEKLEEYEAKFMFYQTLLAVKYLHDLDITHRDIKPENLLMESPEPCSRLLVSDFGLAKMLGTSLERMRTKCGTFTYLAPEVLNSSTTGGYSKCVDCWSLGVVLFTMLSGYLPFGNDSNPTDLGKRIRHADYDFDLPVWETVSFQAKDLISKLLEVKPEKRFTVTQAMAHPWIHDQHIVLRQLYRKVMKKSKLSKGNGDYPGGGGSSASNDMDQSGMDLAALFGDPVPTRSEAIDWGR
ncbi:hypothetical protein PhCBS80983_g03296 [Powellomyces hirtus]|uniref:Protein kinase domain-containing protein n=1 Tax=Powellomyces hirtus TaxID=109895 RepID=A0A507E333_9FUNG|nr:hypothetical protein PhCBS80983_g03296 [Powellomyces hirtus]